jgi:hypothetical protein
VAFTEEGGEVLAEVEAEVHRDFGHANTQCFPQSPRGVIHPALI